MGMLVLSRCEGERIIIDGGRIVLTVVEFRSTDSGRPKVRLGFEADPSITIDRGEVHAAVQRAGQRRTKERSEDREAGSDLDGAAGSAGAPRAMSAE